MDAGVSKVDPGVRDYITQRLQETLYQTAETGVLYQTADARDSIRQQMQETIYMAADAREFIRQDARDYIRQDAGVSISDSGCKRLYHTAVARDSISDSGDRSSISDSRCKRLYQTADARDYI